MTTENTHAHPVPEDPKAQDAPPDIHRPGYFRLKEITLVVSHSKEFNAWDEWLGGLSRALSLAYPLRLVAPLTDDEGAPSPVSTFPGQEGSRIQSIVHTELFDSDSESTLFTDPERWDETDPILVKAVNTLNEAGVTHFEDVVLQAAAPNWLFSSAAHQITHGGPGGLPVEIHTTPVVSELDFYKGDVDNLIAQCKGSRDVTVVILDSVPPPKAVASNQPAAAAQFDGAFQQFTTHPVVQNLSSRLTMLRATSTGVRLPPVTPPAYYATLYDEVDMSDHGSFIAGIINNFAPNVPIILVEALNGYGVGATDVFAECLRMLATGQIIPDLAKFMKADSSLVLNCSLTIDIPPPDEDGVIRLQYHNHDGQDIGVLTLNSPDLLLEPARAALRHFNRVFQGQDVQIVAAAGNEGDGSSPPPPACYPAAFPEVLGVGALESGSTRAYYSNLADAPPYKGVVVWGGKADPKTAVQALAVGLPPRKWNETHPAEGMLGLFVGDFVPLDPASGQIMRGNISASTRGWARWSGTSFSAAVMSGILARAAKGGCEVSINRAQGFYTRLQADPSRPRTTYGEVIISAPQAQGSPSNLPIWQFPWWVRVWYRIGDYFHRIWQA